MLGGFFCVALQGVVQTAGPTARKQQKQIDFNDGSVLHPAGFVLKGKKTVKSAVVSPAHQQRALAGFRTAGLVPQFQFAPVDDELSDWLQLPAQRHAATGVVLPVLAGGGGGGG